MSMRGGADPALGGNSGPAPSEPGPGGPEAGGKTGGSTRRYCQLGCTDANGGKLTLPDGAECGHFVILSKKKYVNKRSGKELAASKIANYNTTKGDCITISYTFLPL